MKSKLLGLVLVALGIWVTPSQPVVAETKENAAFEKIRGLAGDWDGIFSWSGGRNGSGKIRAQYYTTGNGSAVIENLVQDGIPSMTSVYHLDNADLRLTHYCAARNQPRLKATSVDQDLGRITFSFVDITNLSSPRAGHVNGLEIRFLAPDHITLLFRFTGDGKESDELIDLKRKT